MTFAALNLHSVSYRNSSFELSLGKPCGKFKTPAEIVKWILQFINVIVSGQCCALLHPTSLDTHPHKTVIMCTLSSLWILHPINQVHLCTWKNVALECVQLFALSCKASCPAILCYSHRRWGNIIPESVESGNKVGGEWFEYQIALQSRF